jgi:hypothetical protein
MNELLKEKWNIRKYLKNSKIIKILNIRSKLKRNQFKWKKEYIYDYTMCFIRLKINLSLI